MTQAEILKAIQKLQDASDPMMPFSTRAVRVTKVEAFLLEIETTDREFNQKVFLSQDCSLFDIRDALAGQSFSRAMGSLEPVERHRIFAMMLKELKPR